MRIVLLSVLVALLTPNFDATAQSVLAPKGTLRAAYLSSNPAHAVRDPATGNVRIIVPKGNPEALKLVNQFIDDVRKSGFLRSAIDHSGVIGITVAP